MRPRKGTPLMGTVREDKPQPSQGGGCNIDVTLRGRGARYREEPSWFQEKSRFPEEPRGAGS